MDRIYFKNSEDCSNFFEESKNGSGLNIWKKLADTIGTTRKVLGNYRTRRLCLPDDKFLVLLNFIEKNKRIYFLDRIEKRNENWGQIKGGKLTYSKHKNLFDLGRKKPKKFKKDLVKYNFDIEMSLSEELCEFIGVVIGDGFTNKYENHYQTQITGDSKLDKDYYENTLKPICEKLFNNSPKIIFKDNTIRLNLYSKRLFEILTKRFLIPKGKKCYTVKIPLELINSEEKFLNSTLRGMFNTDGGIGFDKRKTYKKPYIRVNYTSASKELINQVHEILLKYLVKHSVHQRGNTWMIQINGVKNVKLFLSKIGFSNNRHLNKLKDLNL